MKTEHGRVSHDVQDAILLIFHHYNENNELVILECVSRRTKDGRLELGTSDHMVETLLFHFYGGNYSKVKPANYMGTTQAIKIFYGPNLHFHRAEQEVTSYQLPLPGLEHKIKP